MLEETRFDETIKQLIDNEFSNNKYKEKQMENFISNVKKQNSLNFEFDPSQSQFLPFYRKFTYKLEDFET